MSDKPRQHGTGHLLPYQTTQTPPVSARRRNAQRCFVLEYQMIGSIRRFWPSMAALLLVPLALAMAFSRPCEAAYQTCAGVSVDSSVIRCLDGSIPSYQPGIAPAGIASPGMAPTDSSGADIQDPTKAFLGVWHTNREGIGYNAAIDVPGAYLLDHPAGTAAGDLTIDSNGFYVWNTLNGLTGPWIKGDRERPLVLFDEASHRRWKLRLVNGQLIIEDQGDAYSGHR